MPFIEPITIKDAIESIHNKQYLLPAIQREFVWKTHQIATLFDSLMRDYPISSFLSWDVEKENLKNYRFYGFISDYHERDNRHNQIIESNEARGVTAILDGQQRLTSLYIGLKGTYAYKLPGKRRTNSGAFPIRKLCLNLLSKSGDGNFLYDFRFLTKAERESSDISSGTFWFVVSDILDLHKPGDINRYLIKHQLLTADPIMAEFANETIFKLWEIVHVRTSINFFLEKDQSLDKVLNVFIRVNSGGTQLSYSDLLLSIATSEWKNIDAREEITFFVDEINRIGNGFDTNKDFVLKTCLVLADFKDIAFKVDSFNSSNMLAIEERWDDIKEAIRASFMLLASMGYNKDTLTSNNAVIPIAAYLYKIKTPHNFVEASKYKDDRDKIFKWLIRVLLKRTFGGHADNVLRPMRDAINRSAGGFPFEEMVNSLRGTEKSIAFNDEEIDNLLYCQYGQPYTYSVLAFIYPSLDFRNKFHQDHIFPKTFFTQKRLRAIGVPDQDIEFYLENCNNLCNLQLLEGTENQEKSGKNFDVWLNEKYPDKEPRSRYMERHYLPDTDLSLGKFKEFVEKRNELMIGALRSLLA